MTTRRKIMLSATAVTTTGLAAAAYRSAPLFWKQFANDIRRPVVHPANFPNPASWPDRGIHAAWLGHSTVLIKIDGFTLITDPVFSTRAGLDFGLFTLGVKRFVSPALPLDKLPHVDLILLSHAHMDHFDLPSLKALENKATNVVTAHATSDLLRQERYGKVTELRWGASAQEGPVRLQALQVNHWGARYQRDTYRGYNGYVIEAGKHRVLFAGDTANTDLFRETRTARGFDLALFPIGAYNPWIRAHCTPEQAWKMGNDAGAELFLPIHHQTFPLGREPYQEPITRFVDAAKSAQDRIVLHSIGQEFHS